MHVYIIIYIRLWSKKVKFKPETRAPSRFVRPVNGIIEAKFQPLISTGRRCWTTSKYCHVLVLYVNLDPYNLIISVVETTLTLLLVLSYLLTCLQVFKTKCTLPVLLAECFQKRFFTLPFSNEILTYIRQYNDIQACNSFINCVSNSPSKIPICTIHLLVLR